MILKDKTILLTGGTKGVGLALLTKLHSENKVIVVARTGLRLDALAKRFVDIDTIAADLSQQSDVDRIGKEIRERYPKIDLVIHNAAVQNTPSFTDDAFKYDAICDEVTLNFASICCLNAALLPCLMHEDRAVILHVNSGLALAPKRQSAVYCATKAALESFTRSLRYQLTGSNIAVLQCYLPLVDTSMTAGRGQGKIDTQSAAAEIIKGIEGEIEDHAIGKVRLLQRLIRLSPELARKIMRDS